MKTTTCDIESVSRFLDGELPEQERQGLLLHFEECAECREVLEKMTAVSETFRKEFEAAFSLPENSDLEKDIIERVRKQEALRQRVFQWMDFRRMLIPVSVAAALIIAVVSDSPKNETPPTLSGPSAIVTSFSGDVSSVMILETPEKRQTIIWYKENF